MGRLRRCQPAASSIAPVGWRPVPGVLAPFQQIGEYDHAPLTGGPTNLYGQVQRRNGVGDISSRWSPQVVSASGALPWQQSQQVAHYPGVQRRSGAKVPMSRYGVGVMNGAIANQQAAQSANGALALAVLKGNRNGGSSNG